MTIYNLYFFSKDGICVTYKEWRREKKPTMSQDEEFKLVYGMLLSLRSFASKLSTRDGLQLVRSYRTSGYKMNYLETATGLKLVLNTDPDAAGVVELMRAIFQTYVDTVLKNPFVSPGETIDSEIFHAKVDALVKSHPCYT